MDPRIKALPRHERLPDLLAASEDPHPRKTRRIEFIGEKSPLDDERVQAKLLLSQFLPRGDPRRPFTDTMIAAIQLAAAKAVVRIHKYSERLMEHNHQHSMAVNTHLARTYRWHAGNNYIEHVDFADVDAILGGPSGHQFRDLDAMEHDEPKVKRLSPEVFKLIALEAVPSMAPKGIGPQRGDVVARH